RLASCAGHDDRGLELRTDRALGELRQERLGLVDRELAQVLFARPGAAPPDGSHVGEDQHPLGVEPDGEKRRGAILVDDRVDAAEPPVLPDDGDAAAAAVNGHDSGVDEGSDLVELDDLEWNGRGNRPSPAAAWLLDQRPNTLTLPHLSLLPPGGRAHKLRRALEGRIV